MSACSEKSAPLLTSLHHANMRYQDFLPSQCLCSEWENLGTLVSVEIPESGRGFPHRKVQVQVPVACETGPHGVYMTNIQEVDQEISCKLNYPL